VEGTKDGIAQGYSKHYIPVQFPSTGDRKRKVVDIQTTDADKSGLSGIE
jgi:hypothetical protein